MRTFMVDDKSTRLLTPKEAAAYLTISTRTLHRLIKAGKIRAIRLGRQVRLHPDDLPR